MAQWVQTWRPQNILWRSFVMVSTSGRPSWCHIQLPETIEKNGLPHGNAKSVPQEKNPPIDREVDVGARNWLFCCRWAVTARCIFLFWWPFGLWCNSSRLPPFLRWEISVAKKMGGWVEELWCANRASVEEVWGYQKNGDSRWSFKHNPEDFKTQRSSFAKTRQFGVLSASLSADHYSTLRRTYLTSTTDDSKGVRLVDMELSFSQIMTHPYYNTIYKK